MIDELVQMAQAVTELYLPLRYSTGSLNVSVVERTWAKSALYITVAELAVGSSICRVVIRVCVYGSP
jgi:hypothetical protein